MSRVALVTGGTRGIGEAICLHLKEAGYTVVANYGGNDEKAKAFSDATGIAVYKFDVGSLSACEEAVAQMDATRSDFPDIFSRVHKETDG